MNYYRMTATPLDLIKDYIPRCPASPDAGLIGRDLKTLCSLCFYVVLKKGVTT